MDPTKIKINAVLLDDDASQAYLIARTLEEIPWLEVGLTHYSTVERAMGQLLAQTADLVFLDHYLGGVQTGLELLIALRDGGFNGPIVMLTGSDEKDLVADFRRYGADVYICKSELDATRLGNAICVALRLPHKDVPRLLRDQTKGKRAG